MMYEGARFSVRPVPWGAQSSAWAVWDNHHKHVVDLRSDEGVAVTLARGRNLRVALRPRVAA